MRYCLILLALAASLGAGFTDSTGIPGGTFAQTL